MKLRAHSTCFGSLNALVSQYHTRVRIRRTHDSLLSLTTLLA